MGLEGSKQDRDYLNNKFQVIVVIAIVGHVLHQKLDPRFCIYYNSTLLVAHQSVLGHSLSRQHLICLP